VLKYSLHWPVLVQGEDWGPYIVTDGKLITGQNPKVPYTTVVQAVLNAILALPADSSVYLLLAWKCCCVCGMTILTGVWLAVQSSEPLGKAIADALSTAIR
jgi:hypothetical protein